MAKSTVSISDDPRMINEVDLTPACQRDSCTALFSLFLKEKNNEMETRKFFTNSPYKLQVYIDVVNARKNTITQELNDLISGTQSGIRENRDDKVNFPVTTQVPQPDLKPSDIGSKVNPDGTLWTPSQTDGPTSVPTDDVETFNVDDGTPPPPLNADDTYDSFSKRSSATAVGSIDSKPSADQSPALEYNASIGADDSPAIEYNASVDNAPAIEYTASADDAPAIEYSPSADNTRTGDEISRASSRAGDEISRTSSRAGDDISRASSTNAPPGPGTDPVIYYAQIDNTPTGMNDALFDDLPADNPPADNPPADNPPADNPPADNPPADNSPADDAPVDETVPLRKTVSINDQTTAISYDAENLNAPVDTQLLIDGEVCCPPELMYPKVVEETPPPPPEPPKPRVVVVCCADLVNVNKRIRELQKLSRFLRYEFDRMRLLYEDLGFNKMDLDPLPSDEREPYVAEMEERLNDRVQALQDLEKYISPDV